MRERDETNTENKTSRGNMHKGGKFVHIVN